MVVVAEAYSYQLYKDANLVVAWSAPNGDGILLRNGDEIGVDGFAEWLGHLRVGRNRDLWTLLAIPGAPAELLAEVLDVVEGPVLTTVEQVYKTPDGRLLAGVYETDQTGRVQFRPSPGRAGGFGCGAGALRQRSGGVRFSFGACRCCGRHGR